MGYQSQAVRDRTEIEMWIMEQPTIPDRKTVRRAFPSMSMKLIRAALAATKAKQE